MSVFDYAGGDYGELDYDDLSNAVDEIIDEYGYERIELLLAEPSYEHRELLENLQEIIERFDYSATFVPTDNLTDYVQARVDEALGSLATKVGEDAEWPFNHITVDIQSATEEFYADNVADTVYFNDQDYHVIEV